MTTHKKIYLVKFNCGYYAAKQPNYDWSFTDLMGEANRYKTLKAARERGDFGIALEKQFRNTPRSGIHPTSYKIEEYEVVESIHLLNSDARD